ncbi:hypothetical protein BGX28_001654 [Mortierella sp. GBA30]|nr:hypothetical protein BGX28_001654 [Mortierella sp. GBA30]
MTIIYGQGHDPNQGQPPIAISTSRPTSCSIPPSSTSSSNSTSNNLKQGLHRRRGSASSDQSARSPSPGSALGTAGTSSATAAPTTFNPEQLKVTDPTTKPHDVTTADTSIRQSKRRSSDHADSLASLGLDLNAEFEVRVIGNRPNGNTILQNSNSNNRHSGGSSNRNSPRSVQSEGSHVDKECFLTETIRQGRTETLSNAAIEAVPSTLMPSTSPPAHLTASTTPATIQVRQARLRSLDILRGITIIIMILVNTQGADPFAQLQHSEWFGYTLADWVFPNFIFMVGMAIAIVFSPAKLASFTQQTSNSSSPTVSFWTREQKRIRLSLKIIKRSVLLFGIGIILAAVDLIGVPKEAQWVRVPGVLQRIAFCYLVLAMTVLWAPLRVETTVTCTSNTPVGSPLSLATIYSSSSSPRKDAVRTTTPASTRQKLLPSLHVLITLPVTCVALWFILTYSVQSTATIPIDGCDYPVTSIDPQGAVLPGSPPLRGQLSPQWCTAQAFFDTMLFTRERDPNQPTFDSEGSLGSLMAVVTAWFGWKVGSSVMEQQREQKAMDKKMMDEFKASQEFKEKEMKEATNSSRPDDDNMDTPPKVSETRILQGRLDSQKRMFLLAHLGQWFMFGVSVMFSGMALDWALPICKGLWTPSFTLYSAGISINALCILMYLYDVSAAPPKEVSTSSVLHSSVKSGLLARMTTLSKQLWRVLKQGLELIGSGCTHILICYGRNPTLMYILSDLVKLILDKIRIQTQYDWIQTVWAYIFFNSFITFMPPPWASFIFSLVYILLFAPLMWYLNKKGIYLRV